MSHKTPKVTKANTRRSSVFTGSKANARRVKTVSTSTATKRIKCPLVVTFSLMVTAKRGRNVFTDTWFQPQTDEQRIVPTTTSVFAKLAKSVRCPMFRSKFVQIIWWDFVLEAHNVWGSTSRCPSVNKIFVYLFWLIFQRRMTGSTLKWFNDWKKKNKLLKTTQDRIGWDVITVGMWATSLPTVKRSRLSKKTCQSCCHWMKSIWSRISQSCVFTVRYTVTTPMSVLREPKPSLSRVNKTPQPLSKDQSSIKSPV